MEEKVFEVTKWPKKKKKYLYLEKFEEYKLMQEAELKKMKRQAGISLILITAIALGLLILVVGK